MGEVSPAQKRSLRTIISASNRMNELISTLLNITRMESGTISITPKPVHTFKLSDEIVKELALLASDKAIELTLTSSGTGSATIKTDPLILKEIVTNLVSNSIKYTPEKGKVGIQLKLRTNDILFTIIDTGWGIPKESQDQIFSKFFRADNIVKRETTGTGLGLYLVKGLVDSLGGKIWFKSDEGKGTIFYFSLPRKARVGKTL
jgi:signal transduction histidine kinase